MQSDYPGIIGKRICGVIDRPIGCHHPCYPEMVYPINYGYAIEFMAEDGEEQDVYLFGIDKPVTQFEGIVIAVYRRFNDAEDKWIVSVDGSDYTDERIVQAIHFQERFFSGELLR